jgi:N-acetylneuraminic acid mutarotase
LWLFGGGGQFNDLWKFSPTTKEWTWVSGSNTGNVSGIYGTQGVAAASNVPGGREGSVSWIDSNGNLWLFGGIGYDSTGTVGYLNDLWRYQP